MTPLTWHCVGPDALNWDCEVTSFATSTEVAPATSSPAVFTGVSYHDWLFVATIIVAMLAFMIWPRIFKPIKTLFYGE